jgi:phosphoesterase RecJ-like protein
MKNKILSHREQLIEIKSVIEKNKRFLISTHVNPDGDSISSVLLFSSILRQFGKDHCILIDDPIPKKFDFLPGVELIRRMDQFKCPFSPDVAVILDASTLKRTGNIQNLIQRNHEIIHIDHHPESECLGEYGILDCEESSTVELVYYLYSFCDLPITPDIATLVYSGILCDTGRFTFPNTTHRSLEICAEMVRKGASPGTIAERIYFRNSPQSLLSLSEALSTLEFHYGGMVSCMHLNQNGEGTGDKTDTEGFIDFLLTVEGTEVEFFMLKLKPNFFKISFRSKSYVDVNEVAKRFGGGGHKRASGCYIEGEEEQVKHRILEVLEPFLKVPEFRTRDQ